MTRIAQLALSGGELSPSLHSRIDLSKFQSGVKLAENWIVMPEGGMQNRPGTRYVTHCPDHDVLHRLVPFEFNTEQTYVLLFGDEVMRVIQDGGLVLEANAAITAITQANPAVVTSAAHGYSNGDEVFIDGGDMTQLADYYKAAGVTADTFQVQTLAGVNVDSTAFAAYTTGGTVARVFELVTPYVAADLTLLKYTQNADVMTLMHPDYQTKDLTRTGHAAWTLTNYLRAPAIQPPTSVAGSGSGNIAYVVTSIDDATGEESVASSASTGKSTGNITWVAPATGPTPGRYAIYAADNGGVHGFIGTSTGLSFNNTGIAPDYTDTPGIANDPFSATNEYSGTGTYYEQRQMFGSTNLKPDTVFGSQTGLRNNHNLSQPSKDDDSIEFTLAARQVNEIRWMVPLTDLVVLTSGAEWRLKGVGDGALSPTSVDAKPQGYRGCAHVPPVVIGEQVIYVQKGGHKLRSLGYTLASDGYSGDEVTILARHLFKHRTVVDMCWAEDPHNLIVCVGSDGKLLTCTYVNEQEVFGWTRHSTSRGFFESVCSIPEGDEDAIYVTVRRFVGGVFKRFVERFTNRDIDNVKDAVFLDSSLSHDPVQLVTALAAGVFTVPAHGYVDGAVIEVDDIVWLDDEDEPEVNGYKFEVDNATANTFTLVDLETGLAVDHTVWPTRMEGGEVRVQTAAVGGLGHLEGETVGVLNDGNVENLKVVTNGAITLTNPGCRVHVGKAYDSNLRPLPLTLRSREVEAGMLGTRHLPVNLTMRVEDTRGLEAGTFGGLMSPVKDRDDEQWDAPIEPFTGDVQVGVDGEWESFTDLLIRQRHPLPATILSLVPDIVVGD